MAITKISPVTAVRKSKQVLKPINNNINQQTHQSINSYEFQFGFVPTKSNDINKVEHFIDSII